MCLHIHLESCCLFVTIVDCRRSHHFLTVGIGLEVVFPLTEVSLLPFDGHLKINEGKGLTPLILPSWWWHHHSHAVTGPWVIRTRSSPAPYAGWHMLFERWCCIYPLRYRTYLSIFLTVNDGGLIIDGKHGKKLHFPILWLSGKDVSHRSGSTCLFFLTQCSAGRKRAWRK